MNINNLQKEWSIKKGRLTIDLTFEDFSEVISKVNQIAEIAEELNHHPDLLIHGYKNLKIEIHTHEEDEITEKDYQLAEKIEEIL